VGGRQPAPRRQLRGGQLTKASGQVARIRRRGRCAPRELAGARSSRHLDNLQRPPEVSATSTQPSSGSIGEQRRSLRPSLSRLGGANRQQFSAHGSKIGVAGISCSCQYRPGEIEVTEPDLVIRSCCIRLVDASRQLGCACRAQLRAAVTYSQDPSTCWCRRGTERGARDAKSEEATAGSCCESRVRSACWPSSLLSSLGRRTTVVVAVQAC